MLYVEKCRKELIILRKTVSVLLCVLLCALLLVPAHAAGSEVSQLDARVTVSEDGSCDVTLTATVSFLVSQTEFAVPLSADADDIAASGASYKIKTVDGVKTVVFSSENGFSGAVTFVCTYRLEGTVADSGSGQLFTLALPEKGWSFSIVSYSLSVDFPFELSSYPSWYSAYHGVDIDNYLNITVLENSITAQSLERFKDAETLSLELKFPADTFDLHNMPGQTVSVATVLFWLSVLCVVAYRFLRLRTKWPHTAVRHTAVNEATAGEIPCQLFGTDPDAMAIFAHWGNLGYLVISRSRRGQIRLQKLMEMGSERPNAERKLFYSVFKTGDSVDALSARVQSVCKRSGRSMRNLWARRLYQRHSGNPFFFRTLGLVVACLCGLIVFDLLLPAGFFRWIILPVLAILTAAAAKLVQSACLQFFGRKQRKALLLGTFAAVVLLLFASSAGCLLLMLVTLAVQIFCALSTAFGGRRTGSALALAGDFLGLRSFLRSATQDELVRLDPADGLYFYRMLPFAEQLGVGRAFSRHAACLKLEPCPWLIDAVSEPKTPSDFYQTYLSIATAVRGERTLSSVIRSAKKQEAARV